VRTLAIYHLSAQIIGRSAGKSAVASAAYRSGEKMYDQHIGQTFDYTRKQNIDHTEILAPDHAPAWAHERAKLWNEVEIVERNKNSQLAREINIAIPKELSKDQQIDLVQNFTKEQFVSKGMVADVALHNLTGENPHAHIMLTMRPFNEDGTWGAKSKKEFILDKEGNKTFDKKGNARTRKVDLVDWNKVERLEEWRKEWANHANKALEKAGSLERIDHRSLKDQGLKQVPQIHIGPHAAAMEKRGIRTERGDLNRKVIDLNEARERYNDRLREYKKDVKQLQEEINAKKNQPKTRTLEQVKKELSSFKPIYHKAYDELSQQRLVVNNLNKALSHAKLKLETYDELEEKITKIDQALGKISPFNIFKRNEVKDLQKQREIYTQQKQLHYDTTGRSELVREIKKLERKIMPENEKLDVLKGQYEQAKSKFHNLFAEETSMKREMSNKALDFEKGSKVVGGNSLDVVKALGNSLEKVQQEEKFKAEIMKKKLEQQMQEPYSRGVRNIDYELDGPDF